MAGGRLVGESRKLYAWFFVFNFSIQKFRCNAKNSAFLRFLWEIFKYFCVDNCGNSEKGTILYLFWMHKYQFVPKNEGSANLYFVFALAFYWFSLSQPMNKRKWTEYVCIIHNTMNFMFSNVRANRRTRTLSIVMETNEFLCDKLWLLCASHETKKLRLFILAPFYVVGFSMQLLTLENFHSTMAKWRMGSFWDVRGDFGASDLMKQTNSPLINIVINIIFSSWKHKVDSSWFTYQQ